MVIEPRSRSYGRSYNLKQVDIWQVFIVSSITSSLMWISNRGHVYRVCGIRLHPTGVFSYVLMQNKRHESRKTSDWSKSDCSLHERCDNDILFTMKGNEMKLCRDMYGLSLHIVTIFETVTVRKTEVMADLQSERSGHLVIIHCFHNNFVINVDIEPWSHLACWRHHIASDWLVFECVDAKEAKR